MSVKAEKNILKEVSDTIPVTRYLNYRNYLGDIYDATKKRMGSYSYLQFAEDLGFSKTNVIRLVIAGKRPLTVKAAEKISKALMLKGVDRKFWLNLVKYINERSPAEREKVFRKLISQKQKDIPSELDQKYLEYFNEWYYPIIREMVTFEAFDGTPEFIKKHLEFPLRLEEIKRGLELLEELEFIKKDESTGRLKPTEEHVITSRELDSMAIVRYHQKMIEIGRESITRIDEEERDIRALTVRLSKDKVEAAKASIEALLRDILDAEDNEDEKAEVYQLNVQLFPFTARSKK